ncbi:MAG: HNH endonuclease [Planctomycetes bacterium]|jgi:5-methylcytosine-specific restriction endonuclease McrA|nr:HNH endonuclease [Planctomycetota bacterium]
MHAWTEEDRGPIAFAERVLALLDQGRFTATYKYAVMLGLMDLCMEHTDRHGHAPATVTTRQLAEKIIELYWPHAAPFRALGEPRVLKQNASHRHSQAEILSAIVRFRDRPETASAGSVHSARTAAPFRYEMLARDVEWKLIEMPLPRLQTIGALDCPFIYSISWDRSVERRRVDVRRYQVGEGGSFDGLLRFQGRAAEYLCLLSGLLRPLIQRQWVAMVAAINGFEESRLGEFLFGVNRASLLPLRGPLCELQESRCFYCEERLSDRPERVPEVDHFIPVARYHDNAIDNLVVAHRSCNAAKRDFLAATDHVCRWADRAASHGRDLDAIAADHAWERAEDETHGVVRAIYLRIPPDAPLWLHARQFVAPDIPRIADCLSRVRRTV